MNPYVNMLSTEGRRCTSQFHLFYQRTKLVELRESQSRYYRKFLHSLLSWVRLSVREQLREDTQ